jgi:arylamine N-acetyltransferase
VVDAPGYLRRLRLPDPGQPSVAALAAIHRAHVEWLAYTTLDIQLGRPGGIEPEESAARVVATGRAGYCLHLNGALSALLAALGYDVRWHVGGVQRRTDPEPVGANANHLALTVHGLPGPECPDGVWMVDAGLGDALHEPIPLRAGVHGQGPFRYRLDRSTVVEGGWRFEHDATGSFAGMDFGPQVAVPDDFVVTHRWMSTSPQSGFVKALCAQRRDAGGVDALRGLVLTRIDATGTTSREIGSPDDLYAVLVDLFAVPLDDLAATERDALWRRVRAGHDEWLRSQV